MEVSAFEVALPFIPGEEPQGLLCPHLLFWNWVFFHLSKIWADLDSQRD